MEYCCIQIVIVPYEQPSRFIHTKSVFEVALWETERANKIFDREVEKANPGDRLEMVMYDFYGNSKTLRRVVIEGVKRMCEPCLYCQNIHCQVNHVGDCSYGNDVYDYECDEDIGDWEEGCGCACPCFKPILSSESLYEQLYEGAMYQDYLTESNDERSCSRSNNPLI